jgi:hypothetical protein
MSSSDGISMGIRARQNGPDVDFAQIFAGAQQVLQVNPQSFPSSQQPQPAQPRRLADMHTARAIQTTHAASTFETEQASYALRRMSTFINDNMSTIRRLSRLPAEYDFAHLMATYGKQSPSQTSHTGVPRHTKAPSSVSSASSHGLRTRAAANASPLPAPQAIRTRTELQQTQVAQPEGTDSQLFHRNLPTFPPSENLTQASQSHPITSLADTANAAIAQLNRRPPPRSATPLPASPRASLALRAMGSISRRKISAEDAVPVPPVPAAPASVVSSAGSSHLPAGLRALKLAANATGDERMFQQCRRGCRLEGGRESGAVWRMLWMWMWKCAGTLPRFCLLVIDIQRLLFNIIYLLFVLLCDLSVRV